MATRGGEDITEGIKRAARCGYDGVEIPGFDDYYSRTKELKKLCDDEGLVVSSMCTVFLAGTNLSHPITRVREKSMDYVKRTIDFAAEVDCPMAIIYPGEYNKPIPTADYEVELKNGVESIRKMGEYAQPRNVRLCIEAWNRYDNHLINTLAEAKRWAKLVDLPNVGVQGDLFHMQFEELDVIKAIKEVGDCLIHMHFSDSHRGAPGQGHTDFVPILQALKDVNYEDFIAFELLPPAGDFFSWMERNDGSEFFTDEYAQLALDTLKTAEKKIV